MRDRHTQNKRLTMRLSSIVSACLISALVASGAFNWLQYYRGTKIEMLLEIEKKRNEINTDQINEMVLSTSRNRSAFADPAQDVLFAENQGYLKGILAVVSKASPQESEISSIWHNGYERGLSQTEYVGEIQYEKGYQVGFNYGQKETMKALSTIMKSGDNIQTAIKDFVDNQVKKLDDKQPAPMQPTEKTGK